MDNNTFNDTRPPPQYQHNTRSGPPRQWLYDRIAGTSKYGRQRKELAEHQRPWGPCCWVPPPVGWCPGLLEDNGCCKTFGSLGCYQSEKARYYATHLGFLANICACLIFAFVCFGISEGYGMIEHSSLTEITVTEVTGGFGLNNEKVTLNLGMRALALDNPVNDIGEVVVRYDQFCDLADNGLERYMDPADCSECYDLSLNWVLSAILTVVSILPTTFTDILRMYSGYDVNCQKCFGVFFSFATVLLAVNILVTFPLICANSFHDGLVYLDENGNVLLETKPGELANTATPPGTEYILEFDSTWGWGYIMLIVACALKFLEILCHFSIPTPSVTRDPKEQAIYEVADPEMLDDSEEYAVAVEKDQEAAAIAAVAEAEIQQTRQVILQKRAAAREPTGFRSQPVPQSSSWEPPPTQQDQSWVPPQQQQRQQQDPYVSRSTRSAVGPSNTSDYGRPSRTSYQSAGNVQEDELEEEEVMEEDYNDDEQWTTEEVVELNDVENGPSDEDDMFEEEVIDEMEEEEEEVVVDEEHTNGDGHGEQQGIVVEDASDDGLRDESRAEV